MADMGRVAERQFSPPKGDFGPANIAARRPELWRQAGQRARLHSCRSSYLPAAVGWLPTGDQLAHLYGGEILHGAEPKGAEKGDLCGHFKAAYQASMACSLPLSFAAPASPPRRLTGPEGPAGALGLRKRLLDIGNDVFNVLDADGKANEVVRYASTGEFIGA